MNFKNNLIYLAVTSPERKCLNTILVRKPVKKKQEFLNLSSKHNMFGICSSKGFPGLNKYPEILENCQGWLHCFKNPELFIPKGKPLALISESDFVAKPKPSLRSSEKRYDFIYVCRNSNNQRKSKNWELMSELLPILCEKMKLVGILVGMRQKYYRHNNLIQVPHMDRRIFLNTISQSRSMIITSIRDASPRIIPEALYMNVPVVLNSDIYGGWKYINEDTGEFFNSKENIQEAVDKVLSKKYKRASSWFESNYGPINSGQRLKLFLEPYVKAVRNHKYVLISDTCRG